MQQYLITFTVTRLVLFDIVSSLELFWITGIVEFTDSVLGAVTLFLDSVNKIAVCLVSSVTDANVVWTLSKILWYYKKQAFIMVTMKHYEKNNFPTVINPMNFFISLFLFREGHILL